MGNFKTSQLKSHVLAASCRIPTEPRPPRCITPALYYTRLALHPPCATPAWRYTPPGATPARHYTRAALHTRSPGTLKTYCFEPCCLKFQEIAIAIYGTSASAPSKHINKSKLFGQLSKTRRKTIGRNREFQDVPAGIVCFSSFRKDSHRVRPGTTPALRYTRLALHPARHYTRAALHTRGTTPHALPGHAQNLWF